MRTTISLCLLLGFGLSAAAQEKTDVPEKVTYEQHVKPVFRQYCLGCHNASDKTGGLALDSYGAMLQGGSSGMVVSDDGIPGSNRLWQLVNHEATPNMPPNQDKLPKEPLSLIRAWIEGGILEDADSKVKKKKSNPLAFVASSGGKPEGPVAMPKSIPQTVPVVTERPAATTAIATSPWAPLVAIAGQQQIVMYHTETGELLGVLPFYDGIAQSLRFSRDGKFLIAGGGEHAMLGIAAVYDVQTGEEITTVGDELDTVLGADANDSMNRIALGGPSARLRIFDTADGEKSFDLEKHTDWIYTVAYSPDGVLLASGDRAGGLCVWEAQTGRLYLDLTDHDGAINAVAWRDDSNVLASASEDGTVKLWDMVEGKAIRTINAHGPGVTDVAFDHDGRLVTAGKDRRFRLWDASGKKIQDFSPMKEAVLEVEISHDGKRIIAGDWTGQVVNVAAEDPKSSVTLAANPPPVETRLEKMNGTLASIQSELAPLKSALQDATEAVAAAEKPLTEMNQRIEGLRDEAAKASTAAETNQERVQSIEAEIAKLTRASRDAHDRVIAQRLALQDSASTAEEVAAQEDKLAEQLHQLATQRRTQQKAQQAIKTHQQRAAAKRSEAEKLTEKLPPLQQAVEKAKQAHAEAKAAHDDVAKSLSEQEKKVAELASAVK